ncbi:MAG: TrkA family potassium uptake protein [Solirubrobacterales bacterium]|nr:TrkA family potassium uptake protein [Solirubrobacterales bacterium]
MYLIVAGAGKVGVNLTRELLLQGHEVTMIENSHDRYQLVEQELEHNIQYGDASELWVLDRAGIKRAEMVIAVTGDDEDNILICQVAKEKYGIERIIARVNNPSNRATLRPARHQAGRFGDRTDPEAARARSPAARPGPPARPRSRADRDHRSPPARELADRRQESRRDRDTGPNAPDLDPERRNRIRSDSRVRATGRRRHPRRPRSSERGRAQEGPRGLAPNRTFRDSAFLYQASGWCSGTSWAATGKE